MAIRKEQKTRRGCGYRKAGGLYLVGPPFGSVCDRLAFKLVPCPVCGHEQKFNRGIMQATGIEIFHQSHDEERISKVAKKAAAGYADDLNTDDIAALVKDGYIKCECPENCPVCYPTREAAGLMWVGKGYYSPESFSREAQEMVWTSPF